MIQHYMTIAYNRLTKAAIFLTQKKYWIAYAVLISFLFSLFFAFPSYDVFFTGHYVDSWKPVLEKIKEPLKDM